MATQLDNLLGPFQDALIEDMRARLARKLQKKSTATGRRYTSVTNASGRLSDSLRWIKEVDKDETVYKLLGTDYWRSADSGSFAIGWAPPSKAQISKWKAAKQAKQGVKIPYSDQLITDKIRKYGTNPKFSRFASDTVPGFIRRIESGNLVERLATEFVVEKSLYAQILFKPGTVQQEINAEIATNIPDRFFKNIRL